MSGDKQPLPPEEKETIVDVSLKHIVLAFGGLVGAAFLVGISIIIVRDYTKLLRQKAIIDAGTELLLTLQNKERSENWNTKKKTTATPSTSPTKS